MKTSTFWIKVKRKIIAKTMTAALTVILVAASAFTVVAGQDKVQAAGATVSINLINYGGDSTSIDNTIINAHPAFIVDNSPAGPWKGNANINTFMAAGIKYFEYLDGGYEGTAAQAIPNDLSSNLNYITAVANAGAYGIFLDEVSDSPSSASLSYLQQIYNKAHSLGLKVVFNTGVDSWSDSLMSYCDIINSSEVWNNAPLTASQSKWASRTWLLTQGVNDATTAANLTKAAWAKGILAEYACSSYGAIPSWLPSYYALVSGSNPVVTVPSISTTSLSSGTLGAAYSQILSATGGMTPYTWTVSAGTLPAGLTISTSGVISGTPTTVGTKALTFKVTDSNNTTATKPLSITINNAAIIISTTTLVNGAVGTAYSQTLTATGGTTPYTWAVSAGTLPAGLSLSTGGVISGTPTASCNATSLTYRVTDSLGNAATQPLYITINSAVTTPTSGNTSGVVASKPSASGGGNEYNLYLQVNSTTVAGLTAGQQVWCAASTTDFPTLLTIGATVNGNLDNSAGWWNFKAAGTTITPPPTITAPIVTTVKAAAVTSSGAIINGSLVSPGSATSVTVSFDWGLTTSYGSTTSVQTFTAATTFGATLTGLAPNTTYHFRAKVTGSSTVYGSDNTFTTTANTVITPSGNTIGVVAGKPVASGGANEYCFYLKITSTTVSGLTVGQQVWCAATTISFPNLLTVGSTITGTLNNSTGWWIIK